LMYFRTRVAFFKKINNRFMKPESIINGIISDKSEEIKNIIFEKMNRGVTFLKSEGAYSHKTRDVILCIVSRREVAKLSEIVKTTDPDAFVIIQEVHQVLGKGFKPRENIV